MELASRLSTRFSGLDRAHGQYDINGNVSSAGKHEGRAQTVREPVTLEKWIGHLKGERGIGVVPIRDDANCLFGAIDIDTYQGDLFKLADQVAGLDIPLILCRSKSGGPHLYLFLSEPAPADLVRGKLMEWAVLLGYSGVEIFPKQTRLASENDVGNWINMPYFGGDETNRYAIFNGKQLSLEQFLDLAEMLAMDLETLSTHKPSMPSELGDWWEEAPPCLQSLAMRGFGEGGRNNALFNIAVYLRKRYNDSDWEEKLDDYNQQFMDPPLGHKEVAQVAKSAQKKTYEYRCNELPIVAACNRQICRTRACGVGAVDGDPGVVFGTLVKLDTDPPLWIWDVDGARLELGTVELKDQNRFHSKCMEVLNKWPSMIKPKQWADLVRKKLETVEVVDVPPDATQEGQMWSHLQNYCTSNTRARNKEELALNKPWTPKEGEESGRTFFSAMHFRQYLEQQRFRVTERQMYSWLRNRGVDHHFFNIKGKGMNVWSVPAFDEQVESYSVPRTDDEF
jgi:hypothetical protein